MFCVPPGEGGGRLSIPLSRMKKTRATAVLAGGIGRASCAPRGLLRKSSDDLDLTNEAKKTWWGPLHDTNSPVWPGIERQEWEARMHHGLLGSALTRPSYPAEISFPPSLASWWEVRPK